MEQKSITLEGHSKLPEKARKLVTYNSRDLSKIQFPEDFELPFPKGNAESELAGLMTAARVFYTAFGFEMAAEEINGFMGGVTGMNRSFAIYVSMSAIDHRTIRVSTGIC